MSWLDRVSRLMGSASAAASHDAIEALKSCYCACVQRARHLRQHAEAAPQEYSANGLRELAVLEEAQVQRLKDALQAVGTSVHPFQPPGEVGGLNHWARLVQDLEDHQRSTREFRQLAMKFAESLPETATLFADLCREEQRHCERLRALIARADPQALD